VTTNVTERRVFNNSALVWEASLAGHGLAWLPENVVGEHLQSGQLLEVMEGWSTTYPGYHRYYASRRSSPALGRVMEVLRLPEPLQSQLLLGRISDGQHHSLKIGQNESWQWWTGNLGCAALADFQEINSATGAALLQSLPDTTGHLQSSHRD
jgi:hypothetical protein